MLTFFTTPYPNELIYSAIARYHFYVGNIDLKDTLNEVFNCNSVIPSLGIGSHFTELSKQIGGNFSVENLLMNYTVYPYYSTFLSKERQKEILQDVKGDGKGLYTRLGMVAGSILRKDGIYYCPVCVKQDVDQYGEPYIHREHQLQGINYCPHHEVKLRKYSVNPILKSRIEYLRLDLRKMNLFSEVEFSEYTELEIVLSRMAYQLFQIPLNSFSKEIVALKYKMLLQEKGFMNCSKYIQQRELHQSFISKFPKGFLEKYDCGIDCDYEYNWLKVITRNSKRHVHPFRHLLMLYFLEQDVENFFKGRTSRQKPFGEKPWICLNKAAAHYGKPVIQDMVITRDSKTKKLVGTFSCSCGFVHSRSESEQNPENQYKIGRVKAFGEEWHTKLFQLAEEKSSIRSMAKVLGVDSKTVNKYLTQEKCCGSSVKKTTSNSKQEQYRDDLIKGMKINPNCTRTQLRELYKKQYIYLYRHDKEWLFSHLQTAKRKSLSKPKVDWGNRDEVYYVKIKELYIQLCELEKPIRITKTLIGRRLKINSKLERHLDKLPKIKILLDSILESVEDFQVRRCKKIIDQMDSENQPIALWKVQRVAGIRSADFQKIKRQLENYLKMKQDVKSRGQNTG